MASRRNKASQDATPQASQRIRAAAAEIYRVVRAVTLDEITVLDEVQVREGLDEEHVERLAELLLGGGAYKDPIMLHEEDDGTRRILSDGWHRREGYRRALERFSPTEEVPELAPLLAEIRPGGLNAAVEHAEEANLTHGKHLTQQDKRNVAFRRWARGHDWLWLSNRALAAKLGVSHMTISNWRREFEESSGKNFPDTPQKRLVKRGDQVYEQDASGIQEANQQRVEEQAARTRLKEHLLAVLLRRPFDLGEMIGSDGLADLSQGACWGVVTELVREGAIRRVSGDVYELVRAAESGATEPLSDNRYQIDEPEPESQTEPTGWLDQPVEKGQTDGDDGFRKALAEFLALGEIVALHMEMVLDSDNPPPGWLREELGTLAGLLHGYSPEGADDVWNPGLVYLLGKCIGRAAEWEERDGYLGEGR